jgi:hypothetical protein
MSPDCNGTPRIWRTQKTLSLLRYRCITFPAVHIFVGLGMHRIYQRIVHLPDVLVVLALSLEREQRKPSNPQVSEVHRFGSLAVYSKLIKSLSSRL